MFRTKTILLLLIVSTFLNAQSYSCKRNELFKTNSSEWVQTNGPGGGFINDIVVNPNANTTLYAIGSSAGIYKSIDNGESWQLIEFVDQGHADDLEIAGNATLFCNYHNLSKSLDEGESWQNCADDFGNYISGDIFKIDPATDDIYIAGSRFDGQGIEIYKSEDYGETWSNITGNIEVPVGSEISALSLAGNGKIFLGINDRQLLTWHKGKVFYSSDDGGNWQEIDFGQSEDRFIWSIFTNPHVPGQVWISEGPLYNDGIDMPWIYLSEDYGENWNAIYPNVSLDATQIRVLGASSDGNNIYVAGGGNLSYTDNKGTSFQQINLPEEIMRFDLWNITPYPGQPSTIFLPTGSGGVAYSNDNGSSWTQKNEGILSTSINLLAPDPQVPGRIYCASWIGEGIFRTEDYGQNWTFLNKGGIVHPWDDELLVDPVDPNNIWFIPDVPYLHKSSDYGTNWDVLNHPDHGGNFNFSSVYAMVQSNDNNIFYALNNGFGIFKGQRNNSNELYNWDFLNLSEIDYTYSLAVSPNDPDIIFSGYNRKPFETKVKIRGSTDGGESWFTSLEVDGAEAITSVVIDKNNTNQLYAASVGEEGAVLWKSDDQGNNWEVLNDYFNFTTIHSFAVSQSNPSIAYAGVWGGGTYRTEDSGANWTKLESEEAFSVAAIAIDPSDPNIIYIADRTNPILYKSIDSGENWTLYFDAGYEYRRLMHVAVDPTNSNRLYVSAMKMSGPGKLGGIFKIENGIAIDINGSVPKVPLTITIDPQNSNILYATLHESGIYKSTDYGSTWIDISGNGSNLPESGFNNLLIDPNDSNVLYLIGGCDVRFSDFQSAGMDPNIVNGVYRSSDQGNTWININHDVLGSQSSAVKSLIFHNNNSNVIYLGCENGVYYSTDSGTTWNKSTGLPYETLGGIDISGNNIYAFTNGAGLFTGTIQDDYSIEWSQESKIQAPISFAQLLKHNADESTIYASGYPGGIFKSTDNGQSWHEKNFGMVSFKVDDPLRQGYYAFAQSLSNPDVLYLGLFQKGVYRSFNGGETWFPVNGQQWELFNKNITALAIDNNDANIVYIATENGIYTTNDGGQNWNEMNNGLVSLDVKTLYINQNNQLFAGTRGYGLYEWQNSEWIAQPGFGNWGVIWPMWDDRPMYQYTSMLIHPYNNSRMLLGTFPQGIYMSNDGGENWKESNIGWTNDGVFSLICHPDNPEIVYAGTYNGVNRSLDFGKHWEMWDNGMPDEQWVFSIDFDPANPDIMYACSKNGENEGRGSENFHGTVVKSTDNGENWFEITSGLANENERPSKEFYKIIVDHYNSDILYLACQDMGIYISYDAGNSWQLWNDGLENTLPGTNGNNVTNTLIISSDHSMLYFGTAGSGVWRRMISPVLPVNNLNATINNHQVTLKWSFDDLKNNFSHYNVYRDVQFFTDISEMAPIATISSLSDTSYPDSDILQGEQYFYAVTTNDNNEYENKYIYVLGPVVDTPVNITTLELDTGDVNVEYSDTLYAEGGVSPFRWSKISGKLPEGIIFYTNGIVSGVPTESGNFQFSVKVTDSQQPPEIDTILCNLNIKSSITSVEEESILPTEFSLKQNFPNPFNNSTTIQFDVPKTDKVQINIYNISGEYIKSLVNGIISPGTYSLNWNGKDKNGLPLPSGIYFIQMKAPDYQNTRQILLLK